MSVSINPLSATQPPDLAALVNPERVRSSVKRLFQNSAKEILGECFQNSQRARATTVTITTGEAGVVIQDDGHGLLDGVNGFHTLLKIAESYFDNDTLPEQMPMGIGLCALLSHDKVTRVTFSSGHLALTIDTALWWGDFNYASTWFERMESLDESVAGLRITVECDADFVEKVKKALEPQPTLYSHDLKTSAAQGYRGILEIILDGQPVETGLPDWSVVREPLIETTYQGCALTIGYAADNALTASSINWYGQVIRLSLNFFQFNLEVRAGRPVNPRSPTRQGVIEDDALHALTNFVTDQIFAFVCDEQNRPLVKPKHVNALFRLDAERARRECPYVVGRPLLPLDDSPISSCEDIDKLGRSELFTYAESPTFIAQEIMVVEGKGAKEANSGLCSFLPMIGPVYSYVCGDISRITIRRVWWKPAGKAKHYFFHRPGVWALGDAQTHDKWQPVTAACIFAFDWSDTSDFSSVDWTIGCAARDIIRFLDIYGWAGFNPNSDDRDYDDIHSDYDQSLWDMVRTVMGRCVRTDFRPYDLPRFMSKQDSPIIGVRFHYRKKVANAITVTNKAGESVRLKLL